MVSSPRCSLQLGWPRRLRTWAPCPHACPGTCFPRSAAYVDPAPVPLRRADTAWWCCEPLGWHGWLRPLSIMSFARTHTLLLGLAVTRVHSRFSVNVCFCFSWINASACDSGPCDKSALHFMGNFQTVPVWPAHSASPVLRVLGVQSSPHSCCWVFCKAVLIGV